MGTLAAFATRTEDLQVEYEVLLPYDTEAVSDERRKIILSEMRSIDDQLAACQKRVDKLNSGVDALTNQADSLDYTIAAASGILTGLIDAFFVGKLDLKACHD